jgi:hypothetical protein
MLQRRTKANKNARPWFDCCDSFKRLIALDDKAVGDIYMSVQLICPNLRCRKILGVPDDLRGKMVKCQHCQTMFRVPESRKPSPVAASASK